VALGMHQGMEVNLNIKQAAANGKLQLEHPNYILSTQTAIGVPTCGIGHASVNLKVSPVQSRAGAVAVVGSDV